MLTPIDAEVLIDALSVLRRSMACGSSAAHRRLPSTASPTAAPAAPTATGARVPDAASFQNSAVTSPPPMEPRRSDVSQRAKPAPNRPERNGIASLSAIRRERGHCGDARQGLGHHSSLLRAILL